MERRLVAVLWVLVFLPGAPAASPSTSRPQPAVNTQGPGGSGIQEDVHTPSTALVTPHPHTTVTTSSPPNTSLPQTLTRKRKRSNYSNGDVFFYGRERNEIIMKVITQETNEVNLYVTPGEDFKGITAVLATDEDVWAIRDLCLESVLDWRNISFKVESYNYGNSFCSKLVFTSGSCHKTNFTTVKITRDNWHQTLTVIAYGSSCWKLSNFGPESSCLKPSAVGNVNEISTATRFPDDEKDTSPSSTNSPQLSEQMKIVVAAVVPSVVLVVVVGVFVFLIRPKLTSHSRAAENQVDPDVGSHEGTGHADDKVNSEETCVELSGKSSSSFDRENSIYISFTELNVH